MESFKGVVFCILLFVIKESQGELCLSQLCGDKCCQVNEIFDVNTSQCRLKNATIGLNGTGSGIFSLCPGGKWLDDAGDQPVWCVEDVSERDGRISRKVLVCNSTKRIVAKDRIPLTKCCLGNSLFFDSGNYNCSEVDPAPTLHWPPPVHSVTNGQIVEHQLEDFHVTHQLIQCPEGYIPQSSAAFKLYEDGKLRVANTESKLLPGTFCIDNWVPNPFQPQNHMGAFFCIADPCETSGCVRKCCPEGFVLNKETTLCEPHNKTFVLEFHNEAGDVVGVPENSLVLRTGSRPRCLHGINLLSPSDNPDDSFDILPSGSLYVTAYPPEDRVSNEYCVDDFSIADHMERNALNCLVGTPTSSPEEQTVMAVFPYLMFISAAFLIATFVVYAIIPEIRNIHGAIVMCHSASLALTYIILGTIQLQVSIGTSACIVVAVILHFCFLASFTWLNVMSFDIWITLSDIRPRSSRHRSRIGRRFIFYSLYAWGVPLIIVVVGQILDNVVKSPYIIRPNFGKPKCWFSTSESFLAYLYGPIAAILLSNIVFFSLTAFRLFRARNDTAFATKNRQNKQYYVVVFSLLILMGLTWITEVITANIEGSTYYAIPTDILNILTGLFIFVTFVCKKKVRGLLRQKLEPFEHRVLRRNPNQSTSVRDPSSSAGTRSQTATSDSTRKVSSTTMTQITTESSLTINK